jgi:hypothetical protein
MNPWTIGVLKTLYQEVHLAGTFLVGQVAEVTQAYNQEGFTKLHLY